MSTREARDLPPVLTDLARPEKRRGLLVSLTAACAALLVLCGIFGYIAVRDEVALRRMRRADELYDSEKLAYVLSAFDRMAVAEMPSREALTDTLLTAFFAAAPDRYACYFDRAAFAEWQSDLSGSFCGIGITFSPLPDRSGVDLLDVFPDSPAEAAGLCPGDILTRAGDVTCSAENYEAFLAAMVGPENSRVELSVLRGGTPLTFSVTRGPVVSRSVLSETVEEGGATLVRLRITTFDDHTWEQCKAAVDAAEAAGADGLIFDLRDNGGGLLDVVARIMAYVLPDGDLVTVDYAEGGPDDYVISCREGNLTGEGKPLSFPEGRHAVTLPMAVLVNENTASASEIFTAALMDYGARGLADVTVVGTVTYGKGSVQTTWGMDDGTGFKFTVARDLSPSGLCFDGVGLTPDIPVARKAGTESVSLWRLAREDDPQLEAAIRALLPRQ